MRWRMRFGAGLSQRTEIMLDGDGIARARGLKDGALFRFGSQRTHDDLLCLLGFVRVREA